MNLEIGSEILTIKEMTKADTLAVEAGVSSLNLMENAGATVVRKIRKRWVRRSVVVLAGPGNNGGDGFVVARLLHQIGWPVRLGLLGDKTSLRGDSKVNAERWVGEIEKFSVALLEGAGLVVDALFGAGLSRPLEGIVLDILNAIESRKLPCVAVDVPTGIDGNTGEVLGGVLNADLTVTFFRKKPGHLILPGRQHCGEVEVTDIGIPSGVLKKISPVMAENSPQLWVDKLPVPAPGFHKYSRGHVVIVGGSEMTGAARLAARAARRAGAGILSIVSPTNAKHIYEISDAGNLVLELSAKKGLSGILDNKRRNAVLVGPGNGVTELTRKNAISALTSKNAVVLDADALTAFEGDPETLFSSIKGRCVLTPHQGEFDRLFKINGDKLSRCKEAAKLANSVIILKGFDTIIAEPNGRVVINANAPADLATAGAGDVLAGIIIGLMSQGMEAFEAACAAVWLHGEAAKELGAGLIAEDLSEVLPYVLDDIRKQTTSNR